MTFSIKDGSTWRTAKSVSINDGGNWRTAKGVWVKDGSDWRSAWALNSAVTIAYYDPSHTTGYDTSLSLGSASPSEDSLGNTFSRLSFSLDSGYTRFLLTGSAGQFSSYTQTNYATTIAVVGVSSATFASCSFFELLDGDSKAQWYWTTDVLGLGSKSGTTVQIQAYSA